MGREVIVFGENLKQIQMKRPRKRGRTSCSICFEEVPAKRYVSTCQHEFCEACMLMWIATEHEDGKLRRCPVCRRDIENDIEKFNFNITSQNYEAMDPVKFKREFEDFFDTSHSILDGRKSWIDFKISENHSEKFARSVLDVFTSVTIPMDEINE